MSRVPPPPPLLYAEPSTNQFAVRPWSPWGIMVTATLVSLLMTGASAFLSIRMVPILKGFKVDPPVVTQIAIVAARLIWDDFGWVPLILASVLLPMFVIPRLPVPSEFATRRSVVRFTRLVAIAFCILLAAFVAAAVFAPMLALVQSVSGPQRPKK